MSGAIEPSAAVCDACGKAGGYVYTGPCYVEDDFAAALCPWCIADGRAFLRFGVTFAEISPGPGFDLGTAEEIEERTPGIATWNPIQWPACCELPMAYLEPVGTEELQARHAKLAQVLPAQLAAAQRIDLAAAEALCQQLQRDGSPTLHVFRCLRCKREQGVLDTD